MYTNKHRLTWPLRRCLAHLNKVILPHAAGTNEKATVPSTKARSLYPLLPSPLYTPLFNAPLKPHTMTQSRVAGPHTAVATRSCSQTKEPRHLTST